MEPERTLRPRRVAPPATGAPPSSAAFKGQSSRPPCYFFQSTQPARRGPLPWHGGPSWPAGVAASNPGGSEPDTGLLTARQRFVAVSGSAARSVVYKPLTTFNSKKDCQQWVDKNNASCRRALKPDWRALEGPYKEGLHRMLKAKHAGESAAPPVACLSASRQPSKQLTEKVLFCCPCTRLTFTHLHVGLSPVLSPALSPAAADKGPFDAIRGTRRASERPLKEAPPEDSVGAPTIVCYRVRPDLSTPSKPLAAGAGAAGRQAAAAADISGVSMPRRAALQRRFLAKHFWWFFYGLNEDAEVQFEI
ncbi:hypothetical protein Efla_004111 [Eimeria flavescens]